MCRPGGPYAWEWPLECENWRKGVWGLEEGSSQYTQYTCIGGESVLDESLIKPRLEDYQRDWTGQCDVKASDYAWPTYPFARRGEAGYEYDGCWQQGSNVPDPAWVTSSVSRVYVSGSKGQLCDKQILPGNYFAIRRDR